MKLRNKQPFDGRGTEGMLDVILGCTLIFLLLTALARIDEGTRHETALPDIDLTRSTNAAEGATAVTKTVVSLKAGESETQIWIDDRQIAMDQLETELKLLGPGAHLALRRDRDLPCGVEDQVILACREAGIERVSITVQKKEK